MSEKPEQTKIPIKKVAKKSTKKAVKKPAVELKDAGTKIAPETPKATAESKPAIEVKPPAAPKDEGPKTTAETPKPAEVQPPAGANPTVTSSPVSAPKPAPVPEPAEAKAPAAPNALETPKPAPVPGKAEVKTPAELPKPATEPAKAGVTGPAEDNGWANIKRKISSVSKSAGQKIKAGSKVASQKIKTGSKQAAAKAKDLGTRAASTIKRMDKPAKILVLALMIVVVLEIPLFLSIGANLRTANRAPVLNGVTPTASFSMIDEGTNVQFDLNPSDPDGDVLSFNWTLDGTPVGGNRSSYVFETNYFTGGLVYNITAIVSDGITQVTQSWAINVTNKVVRLTNADPYNEEMYAVGNLVFFTVDAAVDELWCSDGTESGTRLIRELSPSDYCALGNIMYFAASDTSRGEEIWKSDGTYDGTVPITNFPGTGTIQLSYLTAWRGNIYFRADNGTGIACGEELWKTDGTEAGTVLLKDIAVGSGGSNPYYFAPAGNYLYFTADDGGGSKLWRTDGTTVGTIPLNTVFPDDGENMIAFGNTLMFAGGNATNGTELWKSDGTPAGTVMVKDINPNTANSYPDYMTIMGNAVYFSANDGTSNGRELWKSDGTTAGTVLVKDINTGGDCDIETITLFNNILLFEGSDVDHGSELFRSDGTATGTYLVKDIYPGGGSNSSYPYVSSCTRYPYTYKYGISGNRIVFGAEDAVHGDELWCSDGTAAGTVLVKDINAGDSFSNSDPDYFLTVGNAAFFLADDPVRGSGIYIY